MPLYQAFVDNLVAEPLKKPLFPGISLAVVSRSQPPQFFSYGRVSYAPEAQQVTAHTVYDIASLTKTMATATVTLRLIDQGKLQLNKLVRTYLPELNCDFADQITLHHLLTFTVPFTTQLSAIKNKSATEILEAVLSAPVSAPPGTTYAYVNTTSIILGLVLEKVSALTLPDLVAREVLDPLQLKETSFWPNQLQAARFEQGMTALEIAPTEFDKNWRGKLIQGEVHDESAWKLREKLVAGSAGLFSTAHDVARYLQHFLRSDLTDPPYLSQQLVEQLYTNQTPAGAVATTLGWEFNQPWMGEGATTRLGKTGFTGCTMSFDFELGLGVVLLSNMIHPQRPVDREPWQKLIRQLHTKLYSI